MLDFPAPRSAVTSDRRPVTLRPITCEDRNALRAFHQTLSPHTVYLRYFGSHPRLSEADLGSAKCCRTVVSTADESTSYGTIRTFVGAACAG